MVSTKVQLGFSILNWGLLYSKEPALQQSFNTANDKLIRVRGAEISSKEVHKSDGEMYYIHVITYIHIARENFTFPF